MYYWPFRGIDLHRLIIIASDEKYCQHWIMGIFLFVFMCCMCIFLQVKFSTLPFSAMVWSYIYDNRFEHIFISFNHIRRILVYAAKLAGIISRESFPLHIRGQVPIFVWSMKAPGLHSTAFECKASLFLLWLHPCCYVCDSDEYVWLCWDMWLWWICTHQLYM